MEFEGLSNKEIYEKRTRHLETPEFVQWFETWYAKEEDYANNLSLRDAYLTERNFALVGWLAAKTPDAHKMSEVEFVCKVLPMGANVELTGE
jgi:hypothetical protein